jgi:hypothetical protein
MIAARVPAASSKAARFILFITGLRSKQRASER